MGLVGHAYSLLYKWWVMFLTSSPYRGPRQLGRLNLCNPYHSLPCVCTACVCMYKCAFVPVCVYKLPHGHLSFTLSQAIFQLRHTQSPTHTQLCTSLPFTRNSQPECIALAPWYNSLSSIRNKSALFSQNSPVFHKLFIITSLCLSSRGDKSHYHLV